MLDKEKLLEAGINYDVALHRFADKADLYEKYLLRFEDDMHFQSAKEALSEKDYDKVLADVHAMKGVVGTLGMDHLFESCSLVVKSIRAGEFDKVQEQMKDVQQSYDKVMGIYK